MSLFDRINSSAAQCPEWVKLRTSGDTIAGTLVNIVERQRRFNNEVVLNRSTGAPRLEWILTIETFSEDVPKKVAANESLQRAILKAVKETGELLQVGSLIAVEVATSTEDKVQATYRVEISAPLDTSGVAAA